MRLKREIKNQLNLVPKMSSAAKGVLEVLLDGKLIFSYRAEGRMPGRGEIVGLIQASSLP